MSGNKAASMFIFVIGFGLLVVSLLADVIGVGDDPGFGGQQTMGTIAGVVIMVVGFVLTVRANR